MYAYIHDMGEAFIDMIYAEGGKEVMYIYVMFGYMYTYFMTK